MSVVHSDRTKHSYLNHYYNGKQVLRAYNMVHVTQTHTHTQHTTQTHKIKFSDKKVEESGVCDIPWFQGFCEEEGERNLKRIKQILIELYYPQLRHFRQVTWDLTSTLRHLTSGLTWHTQMTSGLMWQLRPRVTTDPSLGTIRWICSTFPPWLDFPPSRTHSLIENN
jgi:hypothetical protein